MPAVASCALPSSGLPASSGPLPEASSLEEGTTWQSQLDLGGKKVGVKRALRGLEAAQTWGSDMGLECGLSLGWRQEVPSPSWRSWEKPRPALNLVRSPQNPRASQLHCVPT